MKSLNRSGTGTAVALGDLHAGCVGTRIAGSGLVALPTVGGAVANGRALTACPLGGSECVGGDACLSGENYRNKGEGAYETKEMLHDSLG